MSFNAQSLTLLREIRDRLNPEPKPAYIDRDTLSKAAVVSAFARRVDGGLEIDGKDFSQYIIQSDGSIGDVSYRVKNLNADWTTEIEASRLPYVPGPVELIQFKNDTAESGKSIFVTKMRVPNLSAAPPPLPEEEVDPNIGLGAAVGGSEFAHKMAALTNAVPIELTAYMSTTNTIATFHRRDADYQVPAGKKFWGLKLIWNLRLAAETMAIGYGDDGVADGTTDPTTPIWVLGSNVAINNARSPLIQLTVDFPHETVIFLEIPAEKFPFFETGNDSADKNCVMTGIEVDA